MRAALLLRVMLQSWWLLGWTRMKWLYSFSCGFFGVVIFGSWWARLVLAALGRLDSGPRLRRERGCRSVPGHQGAAAGTSDRLRWCGM